jgi:chromosome segregation and condensation protein ScpB
MLKEMGLIEAERSGRSMVLKTTEYFADYFGLTHDTGDMKKELRKIFVGRILGNAAHEMGQP